MARSDRGGPDAADARPLTIGALSRATRIPVETLRTWERRYGAPMPVRKPSGHRLYPAAAVGQLRRVGRLLAQGHRPGEILGLSLRELDALLSLAEPAPVPASGTPAPEPETEGSPARDIRELLRATAALDREGLMHELRASWVRLGPLPFLEGIAGAFMVEIGRAWHAKTLEVRHEHFASACLSDFLRGVREPYDHRARGPRVVAAMLPGEGHEGGLLIAAALMALRGYRVLYLGASTPIEQIAAAARAANAEAVAISVSAAMPRARSARAIARLRKALPARLALWVGGAGSPAVPRGVERFESLAALDARLVAPLQD
jgi:DNA-binding transcriptional MerR regulator/methylmalonyl-CoA mutase cobalamin-binding subunit